MKVSVSWLRDYVTVDAPLKEVAQVLVEAGIEVGELSDDAAGIIVARVVALEPVSGSAHLLLADLDIGPLAPASLVELGIPTTPLRVVTGAPNLRVSDLVPYAPPGSRPPALDEPLGVRTFRGKLRSPGMLCSAAELGLGSDSAGILVLDHGTPGQPLSEVEDTDSVLEVEVTTNRPDCLCHVGIARELAASFRESLTEPPATISPERESAASSTQRVSVLVDDAERCRRFMVRVIENVAVRESPAWMQRRLRAIGLRPINNVVDVTNYVAHELGQPLHAFDLDRFAAAGGDRQARVTVRRARAGETLRCLDGVTRSLTEDDVLVCAGDVAASLGGIIGGGDTAVGPETRTVLLEAASWEPAGIRSTSRRLGLRTDASSIFEKGISDTLPPGALDRAAALIAEHADGHVLRDVVEQWPAPLPEIAPIHLTASRIERLLGMQVDASEVATGLARLGFAVEQDGGSLLVTPPHFRRDVRIAEDVVEEVGRALGYARFPSTLPGRRSRTIRPAPPPRVEERIRDLCAGAGYHEAITLSFVSPWASAALPGAGGERSPLPLQNPLSEEWSVMRTSLLPGLAQALATNVNRGVSDPALFEVGRVFWEGERSQPPPGSTPDGADAGLPPLPLEPLLLALVAQTDDVSAEASARRLRHIQSVAEHACRSLAGLELEVVNVESPWLAQGRAATLRLEGEEAGVLGELSAETAACLGLRGRVVAGELRLDRVAEAALRLPRFLAPPAFPPILRDLAVSVPLDQPAGPALAAMRRAGSPLLEDAELYDEFRGGQLPEGRKGWTFHLRFRAADRTLTAEEAQGSLDAVVAALETTASAEVRR